MQIYQQWKVANKTVSLDEGLCCRFKMTPHEVFALWKLVMTMVLFFLISLKPHQTSIFKGAFYAFNTFVTRNV